MLVCIGEKIGRIILLNGVIILVLYTVASHGMRFKMYLDWPFNFVWEANLDNCLNENMFWFKVVTGEYIIQNFAWNEI